MVRRELTGARLQGVAIERLSLTNRNGIRLDAITYGGIITELHVPDRDGKFADVVLGFDGLKGYLGGHPYFGAVVGRSRVSSPRLRLSSSVSRSPRPIPRCVDSVSRIRK